MPRQERVPSGVLFLVVGAGIVTTARAMTLSFLAIKLEQTFGLGPTMIGILLGLGPLLGALVAPLVGALSDKVGRKVVLTVVMNTLAVAMIGMGQAETVLLFCIAQALAAVVIAVYGPISRALMSDICPEPVRLKYFSWRYTASNIGWAIGPLIGVAAGIASTELFLVAAAVYASLAIALHFLNFPSLLLSRRAALNDKGSLADSIRAATRDRRLLCFTGGGAFLVAVYGQWMVTLAPYLTSSTPDGAQIFALMVSINGAVVFLGNPFARRFVERNGPLRALLTGCALVLVAQLGFVVSNDLTGFAVSMVIFTIGEILIIPSEYILVDEISTAQNRGSYFGAHSTSSVGSFIGPVVGGATLEIYGGPEMFAVYAGFLVLGALHFSFGVRMPPPRH